MPSVIARLRSLWRALRREGDFDADMHDEMRFHIEMEAERLMRRHDLSLEEARRRAHVAFGGIEKYKVEGRDTSRWRRIDALRFDTRLGLRMLAKYPTLTVVGALAIAVAIAICATFFEVTSQLLQTSMPIAEGKRVVALQRVAADDFYSWSNELTTLQQVSAFRTVRHNLAVGDTAPEPLKIAEMTASGFALARTAPLLGRYLLAADEREGAAPVIVIGHQAWWSRFGGDPEIVGRTIMLGGVSHTVVGVMPEEFGFPHSHQYWIPVRDDLLRDAASAAPPFSFFGRLGPGVTLEEAQAQLSTVAQRAVTPDAKREGLPQPLVVPYTLAHVDLSNPILVWMFRVAQLLVGALTVVVAVNLAILIYARTVTRLGELSVRTALGASRSRILAQLFIEAFVLAVVGAAIGLAFAGAVLRGIQAVARNNGDVPYWIHFGLSIETMAYALGLAALSAMIMGVLPGVKALGRNLHANLHDLSGRSGTRLGPVWTTLVVTQVAVAVTILPAAVFAAWQAINFERLQAGFAADKVVVGLVSLAGDGSAVDPDRIAQRQLELETQLTSEANVSGVTFSSSIPGFAGSKRVRFEEGVTATDETPDPGSLDVSIDLFDTLGVEMVAGRPFSASDTGAAGAVIVNQAFAKALLGGRSPLGLSFQYEDESTEDDVPPDPRWYQVVGVVRDFPAFQPAFTMGIDAAPTVYHAALPGANDPFVVSVRFAGNVPDGFAGRLREIAADIDPRLQLRRIELLSDFYGQTRSFWRYFAWGISLATTSVLLLSAAGMYALMSFAVARRTREIGIRTALGANPRRILASVFGRAMLQLGLGVLVGSLFSGAAFSSLGLGLDRATPLLVGVAGLMSMVGMLAAIGPARKGLRIQASEALRADA